MSRDENKPFNNPFSKLAAQKDALPRGREKPLVVPLDAGPKGPAWAVIRREKKGHGGKEVTRVEKLDLRARELEVWCTELKRKLGVGGSVDGSDLLFQGDQRERLQPLLTARGVKKVTVG
jgi:translation initiation factor 1